MSRRARAATPHRLSGPLVYLEVEALNGGVRNDRDGVETLMPMLGAD